MLFRNTIVVYNDLVKCCCYLAKADQFNVNVRGVHTNQPEVRKEHYKVQTFTYVVGTYVHTSAIIAFVYARVESI